MKTIPLVTLLLSIGCCAMSARAAGRPENVQELLGSKANVAIVRDATIVRACSLKPLAPTTDAAGHKIAPDVLRASDRGAFVPLSPASAATLKRLLLDARSYKWFVTSFCLPNYTIRAEFEANGKTVAANICFRCNQVLFSQNKNTLGDCDLANPTDELFQVFRQLFPDDPVLAKIAHTRETHRD